jgi:polar amino acid transport system substrate-binding protein
MKQTIFLIVFFLTSTTVSMAQEPIHLGSMYDAPLSTANQTGILDLLTKEAFRRIGKQVIILKLPGERSLLNANEGIEDGDILRIAGMSKKYPNLIQIPEKLIDFEAIAFSNKINLRTESLDDLKPYDIAIIRGWKYFEKNLKGVRSLIAVEDATILFGLLKNERVDIVIYEKLQGLVMTKRLGIKGSMTLQPSLIIMPSYIYLHKKHKPLVHDLAEALKKMKHDGTYDGIIKRVLSRYNK